MVLISTRRVMSGAGPRSHPTRSRYNPTASRASSRCRDAPLVGRAMNRLSVATRGRASPSNGDRPSSVPRIPSDSSLLIFKPCRIACTILITPATPAAAWGWPRFDVAEPSPDASARRYSLPPERAEVLTDRESLAYMAPFGDMLSTLGSNLDDLVEAYRSGDGFGWHQHGDGAHRNLAGVPSVVYGILGLAVFVQLLGTEIGNIPLVGGFLGDVFGDGGVTGGRTVIAGGITLAVVVLPIVIITASESIRAVPQSLREGGYGVGAARVADGDLGLLGRGRGLLDAEPVRPGGGLAVVGEDERAEELDGVGVELRLPAGEGRAEVHVCLSHNALLVSLPAQTQGVLRPQAQLIVTGQAVGEGQLFSRQAGLQG